MYDSANPATIPPDAHLVGGYDDGIYGPNWKAIGRSPYGWDAAAWARFPNAVHVHISAIGENVGVVGDVEPGCMTPEYAVQWVKMRRAAGVDPTIYVNQSSWLGVRRLMQGAGIVEPHYWIADWRNYPDPTIPQDAVARQYGGSAQTRTRFDISSVADHWPGVDTGMTTDELVQRIYNGMFVGVAEADIAAGVTADRPKIAALLKQLVPSIDATGENPSPLDTALTGISNELGSLVRAIGALPVGVTEAQLEAALQNVPLPTGAGVTEAQLVAALKTLTLKAA